MVSIDRSLLMGETPSFSADFTLLLSCERLFNFPHQLERAIGLSTRYLPCRTEIGTDTDRDRNTDTYTDANTPEMNMNMIIDTDTDTNTDAERIRHELWSPTWNLVRFSKDS